MLDSTMYIMYTMYMKQYTIADFRANIRIILDSVDSGESVRVVRYDKIYKISQDSGSPVAKYKSPPIKQPLPNKINIPIIPGMTTADKLEEPECLRHHVPKSQCVGRH